MGGKEREKRRKNIIIKEIKVKEGNRKKAVEEVLIDIRVEARIEEVRKLGGNEERGTEMIWVKLENEEQRREILGKKRNLKGRRERIVENRGPNVEGKKDEMEVVGYGERGGEKGK